ncbi:MAG TPA: IS4 family transposase [Rickettsia endosymbiont of Bembidion lapponicum]|nr:IS4 family transposase [Rickettsia endosymbiont of Bembidion lapponicum]
MDQIEGILNLIKDEDLEKLGKLNEVDKYNTKLVGKMVFKGLMRLILMGQKTSLRALEMVINRCVVDKNDDKNKVTYSGLSKRLKFINPDYFKGVYTDLMNKVAKLLPKKTSHNLYRFDSTIINLSGYLIKDGLKVGGKSNDSQVKVSVGLKNQLPTSIRFCKGQEEGSEDIALVRAINEAKVEKEDILLFDRGIAKTGTFVEFDEKEYKFITRMHLKRRYDIIRENEITQKQQPDGSEILEDIIVNLYQAKSKVAKKHDLRLIKIRNKAGDEIWFLTNLFEMPAIQVTELYRRRWDIEVFFKFIKQNLGYKHFLSHTMNGMKVYIYMIIITALLFLVYKIRNNLHGFKIALLQFTLDLNDSFIRSIVLISGGNLHAVNHLI